MKAKRTMVTLQYSNVTEDFEISHAERILRMSNNGGWHLPENSEYIYEDGNLNRRNKKSNSGRKEEKHDK